MTARGGTTGRPGPIYAGSVEPMPGAGPAMRRARRVARQIGRGLIQILTAPDPAPARTRRPPGRRRAARAGLVLATVGCATISLFGLTDLARLSTGWWSAKVAAVPGPRTVTISQSPVFLARVPTLLRPGVMALGGPALWSVLTVIVALAVVAPLPLAVRYPLLGWRIAWAGLLLVPLIGAWWSVPEPWDPVQVPLLLVVFGVAGLRHPRPVLWWMWALSLVPWWLYVGHGLGGLAIGALGTLAFTALAVTVDAVGTHRRLVADQAGQAEQAELEQARRAVLQERARIARELHDVVAHHLSLMAVRAETAPYRLAELPTPVREEFGSLSAAAREALADMRRLLGVLRDDGPAERAPQPQLADLPVLIDAARQAGMPVELSVLSGPAPADPGPGAVGGRRVRLPDRAGVAVQRQPSRPGRPGHRVPGPSRRRRAAPGGQRSRPLGERAPGHGGGGEPPDRARADRNARAGRPAGRIAVGRAVPGRRIRGVRPAAGERRPVTRCLIADDQGLVREGFAAVLAAQPGIQVVGQAPDGAAAVRAARRLRPDVILMDVRMPVMDGLAAAREILAGASAQKLPRNPNRSRPCPSRKARVQRPTVSYPDQSRTSPES